MQYQFKSIQPEEISENVFSLIGSEWMLVTAGTQESFNMLTASWGGMGVLWMKKVCFCFIRPTRYTHQFMEREDHFTLSFFEKKYRDALNFCGTHSGRDVNKTKETGLIPFPSRAGSVYFKEAKLLIECRKLYAQDFNPDLFLKPEIEKLYPEKDYSKLYIGEITDCLIQ